MLELLGFLLYETYTNDYSNSHTGYVGPTNDLETHKLQVREFVPIVGAKCLWL